MESERAEELWLPLRWLHYNCELLSVAVLNGLEAVSFQGRIEAVF